MKPTLGRKDYAEQSDSEGVEEANQGREVKNSMNAIFSGKQDDSDGEESEDGDNFEKKLSKDQKKKLAQ